MKIRKSHLLALAGMALATLGAALHAAPPLVNTPIGNQAKATYTDDSSVVREVFSNTVVTRVSQIYDLVLTQDNDRVATPGSQVFFPHTVKNLGNGNDTIALTATPAGDFTFVGGAVSIYPDANQDGLPDNFIAITETTSLAPGAEFHFVVVGVVPPSADADDEATVTVVANSSDIVNTPAATDTNTDTVTVTNDAVMQVNKAIDTPSGVPGTTPVKYTITYTNTGNSAATDFTITDIIPTGMTYVADSARWSVIPATELTDDDDADDQSGIIYDFNVTEQGGATGGATFVIANVNPGQSGFVTFEVSVNAGIAPQVIPNTANYTFDGLGSTFNSNTVPFTVIQVADVTLDGDTIADANAGETIAFTNELTNDGTGIDTFDITFPAAQTAGNDFPAGTTFQLFQSDGATPMTDSNGNGIPDTGPVAPGGTYNVVLKAVLPGSIADGSGPFTVTKTARSGFNPAVSDTGDDVLTVVTGASVDLTNNVALPAVGLGAGINSGDANATNIVTNATNPGTTTTFTLVVNNVGPTADSYNLLADDDATFGTVNDMPTGWTVTFKSGGTVVSNTGVIQPGANRTITAEVFVPAGNAPGTVPVYFRSRSPVTGSSDIIRDAVTVNTVRELSLQTDNVGQTFPGGSVVFTHTLTNNGNVTEGDAGPSIVTLTHTDSLVDDGFTSVVHYDTNGNGILDAADPVVVDVLSAVKAAGLAPGEAITLFVKVFAPLGAADSASNATTFTATTTGGAINGTAVPATVDNLDTTNVVRGDLSIVKQQAIDANADGDLLDAGDFDYTINQRSAPPGAVIRYRITVTNVGSLDATAITVNDTIPANTTYLNIAPGIAATVAGDGDDEEVTTEPANGAAAPAALLFTIGTLAPSESSVIDFSVLINE
ncbi:MAG: hypothetical protein ABII82_16770 [Verrucomicrobiota bacterium]